MEYDVVFTALFRLALEREGNAKAALGALIRAGKLAEIYAGPWVSQALWDSLAGLASSSKAVETIPSEA